MKRLFWTGMAILLTCTASSLVFEHPSIAQVQPDIDLESDGEIPWNPVARIDPDQPATLLLVNDTNMTLEYTNTNEQFPQELGAQAQTRLTITTLPATLFVNALGPTAILDYAIEELDSNELQLTVSLIPQIHNTAGYNALDFHEAGGVYRY